jgi:hypothetical protein
MNSLPTAASIILDPETPRDVTTPLPEHLVHLPGGDWALWRCVALRGAGFPASQVTSLSSPRCAEAADRFMEAEKAEEQARQNALEISDRALASIRSRGEWESAEVREPLLRALRRLKSGKLPQAPTKNAEADAAVEAFRVANAHADASLRDFGQAYKQGVADISKEIQDVVHDSRFGEAVIWQNRHAFNRVVHSLSRAGAQPASRNSAQRRDEEMIASYLQRYCVKNDTIGFFGPVGWARLVSEGEAITVRPGPNLIEERSVYFESWGIEALAEQIMANKEVLPWVAPRRAPYVRVEGTALHLPLARPTMLLPKQAAVLKACDGDRMAREIAATLRVDPKLGFKSDEDVYKVLEGLEARGLITWNLNLPLVTNPEKRLRRLLERIEPEHLSGPALASLDVLESARAAVANAAGQPRQLDCALGELEATFAQLTGAAATRSHGQTYAARTLVYEDCRRDIEVEIGRDVLDSLGPPLSLLLISARWVSHQIAEIYRRVLHKIYSELASRGGSPLVDAAGFWLQIQPLVFGTTSERPIDELEPLLHERWARVLSIQPDQRRIHYTAEWLRPRVLEIFDAPRPGWTGARQHSPDLMISAASAEAIRRGDYLLAIGELHLSTNTLGAASFISQHPAPDELVRALEHDFPEPRLIPVKPNNWPQANVRTTIALNSPRDLGVEFAHYSFCPDTMKAIPIADLVVEDTGNGLQMRTRDGRSSFDVLDAIGDALSTLAVNAMKILPPEKHNPRVTIDRLVVCRESWSFTVSELSFAEEKDEATRFLSARRWARSHDMPRFVFVKVLSETKPFYVDFDSPIYVDIFAKALRLLAEHPAADQPFTLTEMLPTPDQTWLSDADGRHYTSELRMVAVDRGATMRGGR